MDNETQKVIITDFKMPFFSMVTFMIKWAFAAIPAMIVIGIVFGILGFALSMAVEMLGLQEMLSGFFPPPQQ
jgi:hypothetical protein